MATRTPLDKSYIDHLWSLVVEKAKGELILKGHSYDITKLIAYVEEKTGVSVSTIYRMIQEGAIATSDKTLDRLVSFLDDDRYATFKEFKLATDENEAGGGNEKAPGSDNVDPLSAIPEQYRKMFFAFISERFEELLGAGKVSFTVSFEVDQQKLGDEFRTWFRNDKHFRSQAFGGATLNTVIIDTPDAIIRAVQFYGLFGNSIHNATSKIDNQETTLDKLLTGDAEIFLGRIEKLTKND